MPLPKIAVPTFETTQPSTKRPIKFRPFLVKEEKALLIAKESGERKDMLNAIKNVIAACVQDEDFDVNTIPLFDMEYLFIQIRARSVDSKIKFKVDDSTDGKTYDLELDLEDVGVVFPEEVEDKVMVTDTIGFKLKYPTPEIEDRLENKTTDTEIVFTTLDCCIDIVFDDNNVYKWSEYSQKDKQEFIDSLPIESYNQAQKFFEQMPSLEHTVKYTNSEGVEKRVIFRSLEDFFTFY